MVAIKSLLCVYPVPEEYRNRLQEKLPQTEIIYREPLQANREDVQNATVIFGNVKPDYLKNSPNLQWIHLGSAGTDGYTEAIPQNVRLSNSTGAYGEALSEHMLAMTLSLMKCFPYYNDGKTHHQWLPHRTVKGIQDARVVIFGLGDIGRHYAKLLHALGAYVIGVRRRTGEKPSYVDELYTTEKSDALIPTADVVAMCLPKTPATVGFMSRERIAAMKEDAILINVGRGDAVDVNALAKALRENKLFGAGLDVFPQEPLPAESELWDCPNLLITPHSAGWCTLNRTNLHANELFLKNLDAFLANQELPSAVDLKTGYQKSKA